MKFRRLVSILLVVVLCISVVAIEAGAICLPDEHDYEVVRVVKAATCITKGIVAVECKICHNTININVDPDPSLHTSESYKVITPATCTKEGTKQGICSKCGETFTAPIAATGHSPVEDPAVAATCTATGKTTGSHCEICGAVITAQEDTPMLAHSPVEDPAVAATCTATGKTAGSHCGVCGAVITAQEDTPMLAHSPVEDPAVAATCTATGKTAGSHCGVCGAVITAQEDTSMLAHSPVEDPAVAATCTATGKTAGSHCGACGTILVAQSEIPKAEHTVVTVPGAAATCTVPGKTEGKICSACGETLIASETIPASGHMWGEWTAIKSTACGAETGEERYCGICNTRETRNTGRLEHEWEDAFTVDKEPTCTEDGSKSIHCKRCEATCENETISRLGHEYSVEEKAATCTEPGYKKYVCAKCNDTIIDTCPALGHELEYVPATSASYTSAGNKAYYRCTRCGRIFWDENGEKAASEGDVVIPKLYYYSPSYAAPTPSAAGYVETRLEEKTLTPKVSVSEENAAITAYKNGVDTEPDYVRIKSIRGIESCGAKSFTVQLGEKLYVEIRFDAARELLKLHGLTDAQISGIETFTVSFDEDDETVLTVLCGDTELLRVDTESLLKDTDDVKKVLLTLDEDGLAVSHDDKEIAVEKVTTEGTAAVSFADGKLVLEKYEKP